MPYYGKYDGGFETKTVEGRVVPDADRWNMRGYLRLMANNDRFELHQEGEQEAVDATGTWRMQGPMIVLTIADLKFDDFGGESKRSPNLKFVKFDDIRKSYGREIALKIDKAGKEIVLSGATTTLGPLLGTHRFKRDPRPH